MNSLSHIVLKLENEMLTIDRNKVILKAYHDGLMQKELAKFLNMTGVGVSKILRKLKVQP